MMGRAQEKPWWGEFFDETYADVGLESRTDEEKERVRVAADWICTVLGLESGDRLFDQCCGIGRMSLPLSRRGLEVVGVDIIASYVERARQAARAEELPCTFHHGDGFEFVAPEPCDGAINWFTSFGYARDDSQNRKMIRCAFDSLRPGGRFALDYVCIPKVIRQFQACNVSRGQLKDGGEILMLNEPTLDFGSGMFISKWTFIHPDGSRHVRSGETRIYMPHELIRLLSEVGFGELQLFGSRAGDPFDLQAKRCIVVGTKPPR